MGSHKNMACTLPHFALDRAKFFGDVLKHLHKSCFFFFKKLSFPKGTHRNEERSGRFLMRY